MAKRYSSPVVYWTSKWVDSGETRTYTDPQGNRVTVPKYILEGKRNPNYRKKQI